MPRTTIAVALLTALAGTASAQNRSVQIKSIDFQTGVLEVHNFASSDIDLSGWRFCTHDLDEVRRYSAPAGLNGVTIEAGTSVFVHFNNDAPGGDPDRLNRAAVGNFALPLDQDAYGMQLFFPNQSGTVSFGDSTLIADFLQWNIAGEPVGSSQFRTNQAIGQGLWTSIDDFIATTAQSLSITLTDLSGDDAGSPSEYDVAEPPCPADLTGSSDPNDPTFGVPDGDADGDDFFFYLDAFSNATLAVCDLTGSSDPNDPSFGTPDGDCDGDDFFFYLDLFTAGCP